MVQGEGFPEQRILGHLHLKSVESAKYTALSMLARSLKKPSIQHSLNRSFLVCFMSAVFAEVFTMMGAAQSPSTNRRIFR